MGSSVSTFAPTHGELLDLLRHRGPMTRGDLLAVTRLSRSTLAERIDTLQGLHLVREGQRRTSSSGRPPVMLEFDDSSRAILTIDLGVTHGVVAVTDLSARIVAIERLAVDLSGEPARVLASVTRSASKLLERAQSGPRGLLGVAVSFPGLAGEDPGTIEAPAVLAHWDGVRAGDILGGAFGVPALLVNDAHAMAYGEYLADGRRRTLLVVKVAAGIGAGLVVEGRLHRGDSRGAGQFGHMRVPGLDDLCICGQHGCLATVASGRALLKRLASQGARTVDDIVRLADEHDPRTLVALTEAGEAVGAVLSGVATMLDPGAILLGGPLGPLDPFLDAVRSQIENLTYGRTARHIEVGPTRLGDESAVTGLAALVVDTELSVRRVDRLVAGGPPTEVVA